MSVLIIRSCSVVPVTTMMRSSVAGKKSPDLDTITRAPVISFKADTAAPDVPIKEPVIPWGNKNFKVWTNWGVGG